MERTAVELFEEYLVRLYTQEAAPTVHEVCADRPDLIGRVQELVRRHNEISGLLVDRSRLVPGSIVGGYEVEDLVSKGGIASVYRGRNTTTGETVALKQLRCGAKTKENLRRLVREADLLRAAPHRSIVAVREVVEYRSEFILVMEYLWGPTLEQVGRPLRGSEFAAVLRQLAIGIRHLHSMGVLHRDIKPSNLSWHDGRLRIFDLGLAKNHGLENSGSITATGDVVGTWAYMAPEVAAGKPATIASDLFSCGVVLYELATGRHPVLRGSDDIVEAALLVLQGQAEPFPASAALFGGRFADWMDRVLAKDTARRPQSLAEGVDILNSIEKGRE